MKLLLAIAMKLLDPKFKIIKERFRGSRNLPTTVGMELKGGGGQARSSMHPWLDNSAGRGRRGHKKPKKKKKKKKKKRSYTSLRTSQLPINPECRFARGQDP